MAEAVAAGAGRRRAAFGFVFVTALINSISFGLIIPILPNLIKELTGGDAAEAAVWNAVFATSWGALQLFSGPLLGALSDRVGRRPVLLISLIGLAGDFLIMALAPNLWWLLAARLINGVTAATMSTANAYVADVTPPERRALAFGWMGAAFNIGFILGPVLGGLMGETSLRQPFYAAAALTAVNWLYGLLVLPESLPPERRARSFDWTKANPLGSLQFVAERRGLGRLTAVGFLFQLGHMVLPSIFVLYAGYRYGWTPKMMGLSMMATGIAGVIVQAFLVKPFVARLGERGAMLTGLFFASAGFVWYGLAPTGWLYLAATPVFALAGLTMPGLQGMMTAQVGPEAQGRLQGVNQSLVGVSSIVGPMLFGFVFAWSVRHPAIQVPGLAIFVAASLTMLALLVVAGAPRPDAKPEARGDAAP